MSSIQIQSRTISSNSSVFIIAEAGDNHMGKLDAAIEMCWQAKLAGCDCIKFQHHIPDEEMLKDVPTSTNFNMPLYEFLKKHALKIQDHKKLKSYCDGIGIIYLCTPFSFKAAEELNSIGVDAFKIGSGEMTDLPTLAKIAKFGKPMIISTGMSTYEEIKRTYDLISKYGIDFALTNCTSEYPARYEDINLKVLDKMIQMFPNAVIGHSDHTPDLYTCFAAVALGASIIEKHVTLNKNIICPDQTVSIDFHDMHMLVDGIRKIELSLGNEKKLNANEKEIRDWAFRSIVSICDIKAGAKITPKMIWSKRPGTGIPSYMMPNIIGKHATRDIKKDTLISWSDIQ